MKTNLASLLALIHAPYFGPKTIQTLENHLGNLDICFKLNSSELKQLGLNNKLINSLKSINWDKVEQDLKWANKKNQHIISWHDNDYPLLLKEISNPPPILFVQGDLNCLNQPSIAMVGSRNASEYGKNNAYQFAKYLANSGLTITSGLALGIDTASHLGALQGISKTIAVVATGLDRTYPLQNKSLAAEIIEHGAICSEFPLGTPPKAHFFPRRNRIISGLSIGTLVVEASIKSGSLITANYALEQGRDVFTIPGAIHSPHSKGAHALIRAGAKLIERAEHILEEIGALQSLVLNEQPQKKETKLTTNQQNIVKFIDYTPTSIDFLVKKTGIKSNNLAHQLLELELLGIIKATSGGYIRLVNN